MNEGKTESHFGPVLGGCVALLLASYVFLPVVYAVPLLALRVPDSRLEAFFSPLEALGRKLPAYRDLIQKEANVCRKWGLLKN